jgi:chromosomal replication initiator protein
MPEKCMNTSAVWSQSLDVLRKRLTAQDVDVWLKTVHISQLDHFGAVLEVENKYIRDWIQERYHPAIVDALHVVTGDQLDVEYQLRETEDGDEVPTPRPPPTREESLGAAQLNRLQTFDSFVVGECNKLAHAAAHAVAEAPSTDYNPLFIYGASGLGKTHLMNAIGNEILRHGQLNAVVYVTGEDFMNEMIKGLRHRRMEEFRNKYRRSAQVLLVDDVQFLSNKTQTQEEFFHTFDALKRAGRQIVLTSDVPPDRIEHLEDRLRTRFSGGVLVDMQAPDFETMRAILLQKADSKRLRLPPDVAEALCRNVKGNVRELEGHVNRLHALYSVYREPITMEVIRQKLPGMLAAPQTQVTPAMIIEAVAKAHNIKASDLLGQKRTRNLTLPRHIAMYLARKHTNLSFPELGREFGDRDHSTIQHGVKKMEKDIQDDPNVAYKVRVIEQTLQLRAP